MARYERALAHTLAFEGVYSNDPVDPGGETYKGISRKNWPNWSGWQNIDRIKREFAEGRWQAEFERDEDLQRKVADFYQVRFWGPLRGNDIDRQEVAEKLFDMAVNMGRRTAVKILQRAINLVTVEREILVDGLIGPKTVASISAACRTRVGAEALQAALKGLHFERYSGIVKRRPQMKKYIRGWLRRI